MQYNGVDDSLSALERLMEAQGPFDGLLGFSQGAALAALVAALQERGLRFQVRVWGAAAEGKGARACLRL